MHNTFILVYFFSLQYKMSIIFFDLKDILRRLKGKITAYLALVLLDARTVYCIQLVCNSNLISLECQSDHNV